jgi:squalene-hopene/tetraprenyl-beta-curcumene cyclase
MIQIDEQALNDTVATLRQRLLASRNVQGHWVGRLSSSALSTATAVFALAQVDGTRHRSLIDSGLRWLCENQNTDGGWGDTVRSPSNLSTTMLCYSALAVADACSNYPDTIEKTESWLRREAGTLEPHALAGTVMDRYGKDRTFSVPILTMCALAGRLGPGRQAWCSIKPLPFELAVLPGRLYKWLRLPVVSYALPALIAIGQARYEHRRPVCPVARLIRHLARGRSRDVLTSIQPPNGGFLEAAPLTSFVVMSLTSCGHRDHPVVAKGVEFLVASIREDGSWPIDTNLATWGTTLAISSLSAGPSDSRGELESAAPVLLEWLLACQHKVAHPYTQAAPGGWAWSDLPGAVPDADDTAGALVALSHLGAKGPEVSRAVQAGIAWLLGLQNADGGIPTFCRGWTKLPFDRSAADITAHAVAGVGIWLEALPSSPKEQASAGVRKMLGFLRRAQREDGSWAPLWFGNQLAPDKENPVYGTSRVLSNLSRVPAVCREGMGSVCERAVRWLLSTQNADGGWGGASGIASSIEETALAVDALVGQPEVIEAVCRGADWLITNTRQGTSLPPSPIGLYFAQLWYHEELYPLVFSLSALSRAQALLCRQL